MPTGWEFPDPATAHPSGVVAVGADLEPGTLLAAYRRGMFPMPEDVPGGLVWWSPDPRGVIEPGCFHASRSLHRARRRFEVHVDTRFAEVVAGCAAVPRPGAWISPEVTDAYTRLHELGWAHSIEVLDDAGRLVGVVYGVGIGGFFAGESMFHLQRDASKVGAVRAPRRGRRHARRRAVDDRPPALAGRGGRPPGGVPRAARRGHRPPRRPLRRPLTRATRRPGPVTGPAR
jgi:leucyl/phenylalanyl-tRNA--protein transferase